MDTNNFVNIKFIYKIKELVFSADKRSYRNLSLLEIKLLFAW